MMFCRNNETGQRRSIKRKKTKKYMRIADRGSMKHNGKALIVSETEAFLSFLKPVPQFLGPIHI